MFNRRVISLFLSLGIAVNLVLLLLYSPVGGDFDLDYDAAGRILAGLPPYDLYNGHPPITGILIIPFRLLSAPVAFFSFGIFSLLLAALMAFLIVQTFGREREDFTWLCAILLLWPDFMVGIALGSLSVLVSVSIVGAWYLLRSNSVRAAGVLLGISILLKLYPGFLLLHLLLSRNWRALVSALLTVVAGFLITLCVIGPAAHWQWVAESVVKNSTNYVDFYDNISIRSIWEKLVGSKGGWVEPLLEMPVLARYGGFVSVAVMLIICVWRMRILLQHPAGGDFAFSLASIAMLLVSPNSWGHYTIVLLLPLYLLLRHAQGMWLYFCMLLMSGVDAFLMKTLFRSQVPALFELPACLSGLSNFLGLLLLAVLVSRAGGSISERQTQNGPALR